MALSNAAVPILPELSNGESVTSSLIFSAYFTGALLVMLPSGILADHYGNSRFILLAAVFTTLSGIILSVSNNLELILLARFMEGLGAAAFFPAAFAMLAEFEKKEQYIGELNFLLNFGLGAGVVITGILAGANIKHGILIFTIFSIIPLTLAWKLPRETINPKSGALEHLLLDLKNTVSMLFKPGFSSVWIIAFVLFGAIGVIMSIYPDYVSDKLDNNELGIYLATLYLGAMTTSLVGGRLKVGHDVFVRYGVLATSIGALITSIHPIGFAFIGAGSGLGLLGLVSGIANLDVERGSTMGIFNTCTYGGLAILPVISGVILLVIDQQGVILINSGMLLFAAMLPLKIFKKIKNKK
jgi:MFS family permease